MGGLGHHGVRREWNDVVTYTWKCLTLRTERKDKREKSQIILDILTERLRTALLSEAATGLQYADHFVAYSLHRFVNTICAEIESRQDALYYDAIMWPGWSHKHNSLRSCCLLWIDPSNHDSPSICCWWLISEGVPGVVNATSLSLTVTLRWNVACPGIYSREPAVPWLTLQHGLDSMNQM